MRTGDDDNWLELATARGGTIRVLKRAHPRARRLRLTVTATGARLSYPHGTHPAQVFAFLRQHADWLERKLDELHLDDAPPPLTVGQPTLIPLRGESVRLSWAQGPYPRIEPHGDSLRVVLAESGTRGRLRAQVLLSGYLAAELRRDVARWLGPFVARLGAAPMALQVRPMSSLWGSLDARDRITLDLALALAPPPALRYVLAHELCHLKVRSHAPRFWAWVRELMPDYQDQRDWLREHGAALKAELARLGGSARRTPG